MKLSKTKKADASIGVSKKNFAAAAVLAAGLALGGCGGTESTTYNYYYPAADAGPVADVGPQANDAATDAAVCKIDTTSAAQCGYKTVSKLAVGGLIPMGDYGIRFDDVESHNGELAVIISVVKPTCEVVKKDKIMQGETKSFVIDGSSGVDVTVGDITSSPATEGVAYTAEISAAKTCSPDAGVACQSSVEGILNQGESLQVGPYKVLLDDIETHADGLYALVSLLDANGNVLKKDKISEGETVQLTVGSSIMSIEALTVAMGDTFGAKWAELLVNLCDQG